MKTSPKIGLSFGRRGKKPDSQLSPSRPFFIFLFPFYSWFLVSFSSADLASLEETKLSYERMEEACGSFSVGDMIHSEFSSPNYPDPYPPSLDCIRVITAGEGEAINLSFNENFTLERAFFHFYSDKPDYPESCKYNDYLEIRDGRFGYSDLIGIFCGEGGPGNITSKGRHLWLRFKTDDSLGYEGFKASYTFVKSENEFLHGLKPCEFLVFGDEGFISNEAIPQAYMNASRKFTSPIDCTWEVQTDPLKMVYLYFQTYDLAYPNECEVNFIDIYEDRKLNTRLKQFCGSVPTKVFSKKSVIYFRYYNSEPLSEGFFEAWFTAFRDIQSVHRNESCTEEEYDCSDLRCINNSLVCDGIPNCFHGYDEKGCHDEKESFNITSRHNLIIVSVAASLLGGIFICSLITWIRKKKIAKRNMLLYGSPRGKISVQAALKNVPFISVEQQNLSGVRCQHTS